MMALTSSRIDFSNLNGESLWCIFETKAFYGGALAYAVLSRASKMDCACSASLAKGSEGRRKQREEWLRWCAKFCNLHWAKYYSFQVVSQRHSYKNKLDACWSAPPPPPLSSTVNSETKLNQNIVARIASLPAHSDSAGLLEQVLCCESDERRDVIPNIWLKIKEDFVCNESWQPSYRFTFNDEVKSIDPSVMPDSDISLSLIASSWSRIMLHQGRICSSPVKKFEGLFQSVEHGIWMHCVCDVAFEIPVPERAVTMWVWLLWESQTLPLSLKDSMLHPPTMAPLIDDKRNAEGLTFDCSSKSSRQALDHKGRVLGQAQMRYGHFMKAEYYENFMRVCACACMRVRVYARARVCALVYACACMRVRVCACVYMRVSKMNTNEQTAI